ncbi:MAG TPA: RNA polymerase sigma factor [Povalibacter sp.]|nr:RNA polymerase sigma factor [Povalibacter sp.]
MPEATDARSLETLMREYQHGSLAAFESLYRALAPKLRSFIHARVHHDGRTGDLLQETFLEIHRSRHTYLPGHCVAGWAFGVAQNVVLRHRHTERRRNRHEVQVEEQDLEVQPRVWDFQLQPLQDALERLSPDARATWWLRNVEGHSFDAIARQLGIAATAVRLRCSRASRALRAALEKGTDHE